MLKKIFNENTNICIIITLIGLITVVCDGYFELDFPYAIFNILRWVVSITSIILCYQSYKNNSKFKMYFFWAFTAILFNPITKIELERETWQIIDSLYIVFFFATLLSRLNYLKLVNKNRIASVGKNSADFFIGIIQGIISMIIPYTIMAIYIITMGIFLIAILKFFPNNNIILGISYVVIAASFFVFLKYWKKLK